MGGGGTDHNQNALSFWRGTSQHADYVAHQGEVNRPAQNYLDLRKTAPTRPPPNGTIKSIQKIVCTPSSHLPTGC